MKDSKRGPVEQAVRSSIQVGAALSTPARGAPFTIDTIDSDGIVLLLGSKEWATRISWEALEGIDRFLSGRGWVEIGSVYSTDAKPGTLDAYMKKHLHRATAGWVASVLAESGLVEIDPERPVRVRWVGPSG